MAGQLRNVVRVDEPYRLGHLRPALDFLERNIRPGEPIDVESATIPTWIFYTPNWARPDTVSLARVARDGSSGGGAFENGPSPGLVVRSDGTRLAFTFGRGVELFGIGDGRPFRAGEGSKAPRDSGWARSEVSRIHAAAHPTAWLITTSVILAQERLDKAIRSLGAVRVDSIVPPSAIATRYQFPETSRAAR